MKRQLIVFAFAALTTGTLLAQESFVEDFEAFFGPPDFTGDAKSVRSFIAVFSGGQILTNSFFTAPNPNAGSLYASVGAFPDQTGVIVVRCSGCSETMTASFDSRVLAIELDLFHSGSRFYGDTVVPYSFWTDKDSNPYIVYVRGLVASRLHVRLPFSGFNVLFIKAPVANVPNPFGPSPTFWEFAIDNVTYSTSAPLQVVTRLGFDPGSPEEKRLVTSTPVEAQYPLGARYFLKLQKKESTGNWQDLPFSLLTDEQPFPSTQHRLSNRLFQSKRVFAYDDDSLPESQKLLQVVHLGDLTVRMIPTDPSIPIVDVKTHILRPDSLGGTTAPGRDYDNDISDLAEESGIPPQYLKAQIQQESHFDPLTFRYEALTVDYNTVHNSPPKGSGTYVAKSPWSDYILREAANALNGNPARNEGHYLCPPEPIANVSLPHDCVEADLNDLDDVIWRSIPSGRGVLNICRNGTLTRINPGEDAVNPVTIRDVYNGSQAHYKFDGSDPSPQYGPVQNPCAPTTRAGRRRAVGTSPDFLNVTAQTPIGSSYGLLQVVHAWIIDGPIFWKGYKTSLAGARYNPSLLIDLPTSMYLRKTGSLYLGAAEDLYFFKKVIVNPEGFANVTEFEGEAIWGMYQMYNSGDIPSTKNPPEKYADATMARVPSFLPQMSSSIFTSSGVCQVPRFKSQTTNLSLISGTTAHLGVAIDPATPVTGFQWYEGVPPDTSRPVQGADVSAMSVSPTTTTSYWVRARNTCGTADSVAITVSIRASCLMPAITAQPGAGPIDASTGAVRLTIGATNAIKYQWYLGNGPSAPGGDGDRSHPIPNSDSPYIDVQAGATLTPYWVQVSNSCGVALSETITLSRNGPCAPPLITAQPSSTTIDIGGSATLSLSFSGSGTISVSWFSTTGAYAGSGASVVISPTGTTSFYASVISECGIATSLTVTVTVRTNSGPLRISATPPGPVDPATPVTYTVEGACDGAHYQWYHVAVGVRIPIANSDGKSITVTPVVDETYSVDVICPGATSRLDVSTTVNCIPFNVFISSDSQPPYINNTTAPFARLSAIAIWINNQPVSKALSYTWYRGQPGDTSQPAGGSVWIDVYPGQSAQTFWVHVQDACNSIDSRAITVYTCKPTITAQPQDQVIPAIGTANAKLTVQATSANAAALRYEWYRGNSFTPVPNATTNELTVAPADADTYHAAVYGSCDTNLESQVLSANAVVRTCNAPGTAPSSPTAQEVERNASVTLSVSASGNELTYQWYKGNSGDVSIPITSAQDWFYSFTAAAAGSYWVRVKSSGVCITDSPTFVVNVCDKPAITAFTSADAEVNPGGTTTLAVTATGSSLKYQWYQSTGAAATRMVGTNSPTLTTEALTEDTTFWVVVSSGSCSRQSASVTVHVCSDMSVRWTSALPQPMHSGDPFTLSFSGTPAPGSSTAAYWYRGTSGDVAHSTMFNGPTTTTAIVVNPTETTSYWVRLKRTTSSCYTDTGTLTLTVCLPTITQQPVGRMINSGQSATVSVSANGGTLTYQWYAGDTGNTASPIANSNSASITLSPAVTTRYWVRVSGTCNNWVDSVAAEITVCIPAALTAQPAGASIQRGQSATLSVSATGTNLTYAWYVGSPGVTTTLAGSTASITVTPTDTTTYWVRVSSPCGSVDSASVVVHVCTTPAVSGPQSVTIFKGASTTLTVTATEATSEPLHYQWFQGTTPVGTDSPSFSTGPVNTTTQYSVRVTAGICSVTAPATVSLCTLGQTVAAAPDQQIAVGGVAHLVAPVVSMTGRTFRWFIGASGNTSQQLTSWLVANTYDVSPGVTTQYWYQVQDGSSACISNSGTTTVSVCIPTITQQPASVMINAGTSTTLTVVANTTPLTYQWYTGATPIAGATGASLIVSPATDTAYWVRVTGSCGQYVDSVTATVSICQPPVIAQQPADASITTTGVATLTVGATGSNLAYQWYQGASGVTTTPVGGNAPTFNVTPSSPTDYWVRVSGTCGGVNSRTTHVSVCTTPTITAQPQGVTIFSGTSTTLSVSAYDLTGEPVHYQWYAGTTPVGTDSRTYTTPQLTAPMTYRVHVTAGICAIDSQTVTVSICTLPQTVAAAADQQIAFGATAHLVAPIASMTGRSFRWLAGASGNTSQPLTTWLVANYYDVSPSATAQYWYQVQDSSTGCISNSGTTTVSVCIPTITQQPASIQITAGTSTTLSVVANTSALTYQWYIGTSGTTTSPIAGATGASLLATPIATTNYWVRVTGSCGQYVDSVTATVTVCQPPVITAQPADPPPIYANTGQVVSVTATGTNITYQWYQSATPGDVSMPVSGATDSTLTLYSVPWTQYYWVRVSGTCGSVDSRAVAISVYPSIIQQPASTGVTFGSSATLTVRAAGAYLHYQWMNYDTGAQVGTDSAALITGPISTTAHFYCRVTSGTTATISSFLATVSICYAVTLNGVNMGAIDPTNGCRWLSPNYTYKPGDVIKWFKGASGNTSIDVTPATNPFNLLVCPANAGSYWYRITRSGTGGSCSSDSPAVSAP